MKKLFLLLALLFVTAPGMAFAAQPAATPAKPAAAAAPAQTPAPAGTAEITAPSLAPIATQLGQTLQTLVGVPAEAGAEEQVQPIADTFATALLKTLLQTLTSIQENSALSDNVNALPDFANWFTRQQTDKRMAAAWADIFYDLQIVIGIPLLAGAAAVFFLLPVRSKMRRIKPETIGFRAALLTGLFFARIVPAFVFLGAALFLLEHNEQHNLQRFVILNVINAVALAYVLRQCIRFAFSPRTPHLRLFPMGTEQAVYASRWVNIFTHAIVYTFFLSDIARALRIPTSSITLFQNAIGLAITILAIKVILETRHRVATMLRSTEEPDAPSFAHSVRNWLARHWHALAIAYLIISFGIAILGIENGLALVLRGTILSLVILVLLRGAFILMDKWVAPAEGGSALVHRQILAFVLRPLMWVVAVTSIAATWGLHVGAVLNTPLGQKAYGAFTSIVVTLLILTGLYEAINSAIERHLTKMDKETNLPIASARARTLLPMVRNSVFILFSAIIVLTFLSAIGINIGPLLAGAGVLGVALGFGSQTLVKDFLTGLFIVVENTIAIGDVVKIGAFSGVIEAMSIRTIRLRDQEGSLHILPFSEVSKITNMTKGFAFAVVDMSVSYNVDLDRAMQVMRDVGAELQEDPVFKRAIMEPLEVLGVESIGDFQIVLRARMRTRPGKQWDVKRQLLLRLKKRFDKEGIEIPFPTYTALPVAGNAASVPSLPPPAKAKLPANDSDEDA